MPLKVEVVIKFKGFEFIVFENFMSKSMKIWFEYGDVFIHESS
jgi:hypothetical protein